MSCTRFVLLLLACLCTAGLRAADPPSDEVPVVGRPVDLPYSEASGWFTVRAKAEPTTLAAESPLTYTVVVQAERSAKRPPQRLDLRQLPDFAEQFYIEDVGEDALRPDDRTWEFVYRLKPRRVEVAAIPSLPFVYFNPYLLTANKGFQVLYTDPIPLHVLPPETVQVPVQGPESAFRIATGSEVLERQTPWTPPGWPMILTLSLTPPLGCLVWYLVWRRMYPDAARLASQRRSRAARLALNALYAARRHVVVARAARMAGIVAGYLQQRLDFQIAEPTPHEVAELCGQNHFSAALTERAVRFFELCDTLRFLPAPAAPSADLYDAAVRLVLAIEAESDTEKQTQGNNDKSDLFFLLPLPLLLFVSALPGALSDREILDRAETAFQEGVHLRQDREQARPHFRNAAGYYRMLEERGVRNPLLYRNLGNASLLADDLPQAILSYHRGLELSPNDAGLRDSLAEARARVVYPPTGDLGRPRVEDRPPWLPYVRSRWLLFAVVACYLGGCLAATRRRMVRRGRLLLVGALLLLVAGGMTGWLLVRMEERRERQTHPLVVIARDGMLLRRGNGMVFPPRYDTPLHRGIEGRLRFERGGWVQIELSGGEIGWLPREAVLVDTP